MEFWICVLFTIFLKSAKSVPCAYQEKVGSGNVVSANILGPDPRDTNVTILMTNAMGTVKCCGVVLAWDLYVKGAGFVSLQVWRPVAGESNKYKLLGNNGIRHRLTATREIGRTIPDRNLIHVLPGDVIGFLQTESAILRYTTCNPASPTNVNICSSDLLINNATTLSEPGDIVQFVTSQSAALGVTVVRGYAITAFLDQKARPNCTDDSKTIPDTLKIGDHVIDVQAQNLDLFHPNTTFTISSMSSYIPVKLNSSSGEMTVLDTLNPGYPFSVYTITVRVTDVCSGSGTCNLTLTVNNIAKPIEFLNLPTKTTLTDFSANSLIYEVHISRQRDIDDTRCYIRSSSSDMLLFEVRNLTKTDYGIYITQTPVLDPAQTVHDLSTLLIIACDNKAGFYNQSTLTVSFQNNNINKGQNGIFWVLVSILVVVVIMASCAVFLYRLRSKGKLKVWPDNRTNYENQTASNPNNEANVHHRQYNNHTDIDSHRIAYAQDGVSGQNKRIQNGIINNLDHTLQNHVDNNETMKSLKFSSHFGIHRKQWVP